MSFTNAHHIEGVAYKCPAWKNPTGFSVPTQRCSGDADTSYGNSILSGFYVWLLCQVSGIEERAIVYYIEGDDIYLAARGVEFERLSPNFVEVGRMIGQELKVKVFEQMVEATFLGRHYYICDGGIKSFSQPLRAMRKVHLSNSPNAKVQNGKYIKSLAVAKALSGLCLDGQTPILWTYYSCMLHALQGVSAKLPHYDADLVRRNQLAGDYKNLGGPTTVDREQYNVLTGISERGQLDIESSIRESFRCGVPKVTYQVSTWAFGVEPNENEYFVTYYDGDKDLL